MDREYAISVVMRGKDDYRIEKLCPDFARVVDGICETVAGLVTVPLGVTCRIYADHCQDRPLVAAWIEGNGRYWRNKWVAEAPVAGIVNALHAALGNILDQTGKTVGGR